MVDLVNPPRVPFEDPISTFVSERESPSAKVAETPLSRMIQRGNQGGGQQAIASALGNVARRYPGKPAEEGTRVTLPWLRWFNYVDTVLAEASPNTDIIGIAGENLTAPVTVYLSRGDGGTTPGLWYLTDADFAAKSTGAFIVGHVAANALAGQQATIRIVGRVTGRSGLVPGTLYYLGSTPGTLVAAPVNRVFALADTATSFVIIEPDVAGTPAGSDTEVQFNDGGAFGADPDFTWDKTNDILTLTDTASSGGRLRVGKGSVASPAISFVGDTDTGFMQDGSTTGYIGMVLNGTEVGIFRGVNTGSFFGVDAIGGFGNAFVIDGSDLGIIMSNGGIGASGVAGLRLSPNNDRMTVAHSSTNLQFGSIGGVCFTNIAAASVSNTVTETTLTASKTGIGDLINSSVTALAGRTFRVQAWGTIANTGTPTLQLRFKMGGNVIIDTTAITLAGITGTTGWHFMGEAVMRTTSAALGNCTFHYSTAAGVTVTHITTVTGTTGVSGTALDFTAQWGTASASNTITCQNLTVELIN